MDDPSAHEQKGMGKRGRNAREGIVRGKHDFEIERLLKYPLSLRIVRSCTMQFHVLTKVPYKPNRIPIRSEESERFQSQKNAKNGMKKERKMKTYPMTFLASHVL